MKKRLIGKLLSVTLSAAMAVSAFSVPSFAAEAEPEEVVPEEFEEEAPLSDDTDWTTEEVFEEDASWEEIEDWTPDEAAPEEEEILGETFSGEEEEEPIEVEEAEFTGIESDRSASDLKSPGPSKGTYNLKFNLGEPAGCIQDVHWGYGDGRIISSELGEKVVLYGDEFEIPGYELIGWTYKDAAGNTGKVSTPAATLDCLSTKEGETAEVTALWKLGTYTVTYDFSGGTSKSKKKVTYQLDKDTIKKIPLLNYVPDESDETGFSINTVNPEVTMEGYVFTGWSSYYNDERYYGGTVYRDMELRANWKPLYYSLVLDCDGGQLHIGDEYYDTYSFEKYAINGWVRNYRPSKAGYTFKGWLGKSKGKDKFYKPDEKITVKELDADENSVCTVKAVWTPNTYKLTYELSGGKQTKAPKTFKTGDKTAIPIPTRPGYKFRNWSVWQYDEADETSDLVNAEEVGVIEDNKLTEKVTADLKLYAEWDELTYNITVKNNDGSDLKDPEGNPVDIFQFGSLLYNEPIDFSYLALIIEDSGAIGDDKSVAGFSLAANAKKPTYKLNVKYTNFLPKEAKDNSLVVPVTLYLIPQNKVYRISYLSAGESVTKATYTYTAKNVTKDLPIKAVATKKGWKFKGWKATEESAPYVVTSDKGYVTAIKAGTAANIDLIADFDDENMYSITLIPGASDVKNAKGEAVNAKTGEPYMVEGVSKFSYDDYGFELDNPGWTRDGYTFGGFYQDSKFKKPVYCTGYLGSGKNSNVKLYARWWPTYHTVTTSDSAIVFRENESKNVARSYIGTSYYFWNSVAYGTKDITPKAVKATGFTFKGWKLAQDISDDSGIAYTDASKTYVKKIKKTNKEDIVLTPVFEEISYKVYVNPNGGTYKDSNVKTLVNGKVYYRDTLESVYNEVSANAKRSGYSLNTLSTTKDYNGTVMRTYIYDNGARYERHYGGGYAKKQDASVTLNIIWYQLAPSVPVLYTYNIDGDEFELLCSHNPSQNYSRIVFEYSTYADFSGDVKNVIWDKKETNEFGDTIYPVVKLSYGKNYYFRVRQEIIDSTGEYFAGEWSKTRMIHISSMK